MRGWAAALVLVFVAAGCSDSAETTTSTSTMVVVTTTSTTTLPPTTTSSTTTSSTTSTTLASDEDDRWLQDEPPELDLTVTDTGDIREFERVLDELRVFQRWLALHPTTDPGVVGLAVVPSGPVWDRYMDAAQLRLQEGWVLRSPEPELAIAAFIPFEDASDGVVELVAQESINGDFIQVDAATGEELEVVTADGESLSIQFELHLSEDGRWRLWEDFVRA